MKKKLTDLTVSELTGLARLMGSLACLTDGHDEIEAFVDGDDVRFRCQRCKEIQYGGN